MIPRGSFVPAVSVAFREGERARRPPASGLIGGRLHARSRPALDDPVDPEPGGLGLVPADEERGVALDRLK